MTIKEAKREYNALLTRFNNAGEYFENDDIPYTEKEKFLPENTPMCCPFNKNTRRMINVL